MSFVLQGNKKKRWLIANASPSATDAHSVISAFKRSIRGGYRFSTLLSCLSRLFPRDEGLRCCPCPTDRNGRRSVEIPKPKQHNNYNYGDNDHHRNGRWNVLHSFHLRDSASLEVVIRPEKPSVATVIPEMGREAICIVVSIRVCSPIVSANAAPLCVPI